MGGRDISLVGLLRAPLIFEGGDTPLSHFVAAQAATKEKNSQPWPALAVAVEVGQRFVAELIKVSAVDRGADVV